MAYPKAYKPQQGYKYQILARNENGVYEHLDYAKDRTELLYLLEEYRLAYRGQPIQLKSIFLPAKYHSEL